jgi:hypothetical protein
MAIKNVPISGTAVLNFIKKVKYKVILDCGGPYGC